MAVATPDSQSAQPSREALLKAVRDHVEVPEIPPLTMVDIMGWRGKDAPDVEWLLQHLLAENECGALVGRSNAGKGFIMLMLIVAVLTGRDLFRCKGTGRPAWVILVEMEDSQEELQRRLSRLIELMRTDPSWTKADEDWLYSHLVILTPNWNSTVSKSLVGLLPSIKQKVEEIKNRGGEVGLIVLDTLAALSEGDENTVEAQRATLSSIYMLRDVSGACVLVLHHVRKASSGFKSPPISERLSFDSVRGSSAIVAALRFILQVEPLTLAEAIKLGLDEDKAARGGYIILTLSKVVSGPKGDMILLEQLEGAAGGFWSLHPHSDRLVAELRSKSAVGNLKLAEAVLLSIADGCKDRKELAKRHWPEKPADKAANALKGILNHLRNRHRWLQSGQSMDLTIQGSDKVHELRGNQSLNPGFLDSDLEDEV